MIVDKFTREALAAQALRPCTLDRMTWELDRIIARTGEGPPIFGWTTTVPK